MECVGYAQEFVLNVNAARGAQSRDATGQAAAAPRGPADEATVKLVDELAKLAAEVLGRGLDRMFDGADDMLFEMARRATNNKDQRVYFDTMRVVRLGRPKIGRIFREEIATGFAPQAKPAEKTADEIAYENLSLQESRSLEESIAISSMATKAEGLYKTLIFELGRRIEWMIQELRAPIEPGALSPATISAAFRRSAEALEVEFDVELVVFKLFDRLVISDLGELYTRALRFLDQNGVKAAAIGGVPGGKPGGGPAGIGGAPGQTDFSAMDNGASAAGSYGFAVPPMMDATTLNALRQLGAAGIGVVPLDGLPGSYYSDAQLGTDLARAASGQIVTGWDAPRAYAYVQRAGVVGKMFNELLQDPSLPAPLKPRFDQLRFAVIKNALADSSFFADRSHPVRGLMNELTTLAASARASGLEALRRIEQLVAEIQSQFDVAAEEVRSQIDLPSPVDEETLETFFAQQKDDARLRRQALIEKTRRVVAEELQLQTLSRKLPDGVWPLLNSGWAPLMALRLLKQGGDSEAWRDGMDLLRRILETVDPRRPASRTDENCTRLAKDIAQRFGEIGMLDERVQLLTRSWRGALAEVESEALTRALSMRTDPGIRLPREGLPPAAGVEGGKPDAASDLRKPSEPEPVSAPDPASAEAVEAAPNPLALLDLLMVLSSWFRVYDHERGKNRWLKVVTHHPADGSVTFAEFNGQNKLQMRTQAFLDDLAAGRAEPIDLGPAARRSLDAYLKARRTESDTATRAT
ncbi:MAG: DUF1631 family protein [Panacagrimonas sp.]